MPDNRESPCCAVAELGLYKRKQDFAILGSLVPKLAGAIEVYVGWDRALRERQWSQADNNLYTAFVQTYPQVDKEQATAPLRCSGDLYIIDALTVFPIL